MTRIFHEVRLSLNGKSLKKNSLNLKKVLDRFGHNITSFVCRRVSISSNDLLSILESMPNLEKLQLDSLKKEAQSFYEPVDEIVPLTISKLKKFELSLSHSEFLNHLNCPRLEKFIFLVLSESDPFGLNFVARCPCLNDLNFEQPRFLEKQDLPISGVQLRFLRLSSTVPMAPMILAEQINLRSLFLLGQDQLNNEMLHVIVKLPLLETLQIHVGEELQTDFAGQILTMKSLKALRLHGYSHFISELLKAENHKLDSLSLVSFDGLSSATSLIQTLDARFPNLRKLMMYGVELEDLLWLASRLPKLKTLDTSGCNFSKYNEFDVPESNLNVEKLIISSDFTLKKSNFSLKAMVKVLPNIKTMFASDDNEETSALIRIVLPMFPSLTKLHCCPENLLRKKMAQFIGNQSSLKTIALRTSCFQKSASRNEFIKNFDKTFPVVRDDSWKREITMTRL